MPVFTSRSHKKELLDQTDIPFEAIKLNMEELDRINSLLGGHDCTLDGIVHFITDGILFNKPLQILEIGCGGGDNLYAVMQWAAKTNVKLQCTGVDINASCIDFARGREKNRGINFICSDYRNVQLNFKPDIIFTSLFCHHFTNEEIVFMLQWMKDRSNIGFFINDLHRHPMAYYSIRILTALFSKSYLVKNDAPLSVLRGFKKAEWIKLLKLAGLKDYTCQWKWAFRHLITCKSSQDA